MKSRSETDAGRVRRQRWRWLGLKSVCAILLASIPILFALVLDMRMRLAGFPDGHVTDYERAMEMPDRALLWASLAVAVFLFFSTMRADKGKSIGRNSVILGIYISLFFAMRQVFVIYFVDYLQLDYGQGVGGEERLSG